MSEVAQRMVVLCFGEVWNPNDGDDASCTAQTYDSHGRDSFLA